MSKKSRPVIYTFCAVFLVILMVGLVTVPTILNYAQRIYFMLQADVNQRQARAMQKFVLNRLQAGVGKEEVIHEFQSTIEGTQTNRGYLCLIDQEDARYLSHPEAQLLGMEVKPNALFNRNFSSENESRWQTLIRQGASASGLLNVGPNMAPEIVYFTNVPGTQWTVSSHENASRIQAEMETFRNTLSAGAALLGLLIAIPASFAARHVSKRYERQIERQNELELRLLEADNARKTQELEGARQLQLSMLPKAVPKHPLVDLAAYMQTATEVGGDFYDFDIAEDGTLTIAIGDATGHGLQAGTMVTVVKTLFTHYAREPDIAKVFKESTRTLKRMGLPNLYMALAVAKLQDDTLHLIGAGMPPALVYRAETGVVEEVPLKGMPLGGPHNFHYKKTTIKLVPGDTVALMSDGFPELFNEESEILGYDKAVAVFKEVASSTLEEILRHFTQTFDDWAKGRLQDDITFVVMKVKEKR